MKIVLIFISKQNKRAMLKAKNRRKILGNELFEKEMAKNQPEDEIEIEEDFDGDEDDIESINSEEEFEIEED